METASTSLSDDHGAWAVVGKGGLLGIVTKAQLREAMEGGRGSQTLAALALSGEAVGRPGYHYPYVHTDHSLDMAMRLMAQTGT